MVMLVYLFLLNAEAQLLITPIQAYSLNLSIITFLDTGHRFAFL